MSELVRELTSSDWTKALTILSAVTVTLVKLVLDFLSRKDARDRVHQAEKTAFKYARSQATAPVAGGQPVAPVKQAVNGTADVPAAQVGTLLFYLAQIEQYQTETRARASWSFIFAILAMFAGLSFVLSSGVYMIANADWPHVAAGTAMSTIGGGVSAFITKTFLDVHRVSLLQLNSYFRQPVLNSHILNAQGIADRIDDQTAKQKGYELILSSVVGLITDKHESSALNENTKPPHPRKPPSKRPGST